MPGIALNEDNSHFFFTRAGRRLDAEAVASWVDQYAGTQVCELMLCPNSMRASYGSAVWEPIWAGYDPDGPDDQPLLASQSLENRPVARRWVHTAWQLHRDGIDPYALWIERARRRGISPWLSMRMNDLHDVHDERSYMHSRLWRTRPDLRRVPYRSVQWQDRAFDYARPEVREHHMALIREMAERYDFDGLELDWMRFGFHFRPGREAEGADLLTEFTAQVRELLNEAARRRGHRVRLGARVPSRPQTSLALGMDAVRWARRGLVDMLVITPFWASVEPDMPVELWKDLLEGTGVTLAAGLEVLVRPHPGAAAHTNSLETARGAAAALLHRGADRIYLFNYMDSDTAMGDMDNYGVMLREAGSLETLKGKPRRHVVTYADTWAPGEPPAALLPARCSAGGWSAFRIPIGPRPRSGQALVVLCLEQGSIAGAEGWDVFVNCERCPSAGAVNLPDPSPGLAACGFRVPLDALRDGCNLVDVRPSEDVTFGWVEIMLNGTEG